MINQNLKLADSKFIRYVKSYLFLQGKWVGFYGNFGHGDLGDDASFYATKKMLGDNLLPFSKRSYAFNPRVFRALLVGGGGNLRWECPYIPRKLLTKKKWDFPVILFAAGVNCDYDKEYSQEAKDQIQRLCECCDYLTVRDLLSKKFIESFNFKDVHLLPDLELMLEEQPINLSFPKDGKTIGIVLSPHSEFNAGTLNKIKDNFIQLTNNLTEKNYQVLFIPFERNISENNREERLINEIVKGVKKQDSIKVLSNDLSPQEILHIMKHYCDMMICMRLHSAVFAVNAGVPFFCVSFNLMHKAFMQLLDWPQWEISLFDDFSAETLQNKFDDLEYNRESLQGQLIKKRDYLKEVIQDQMRSIKQRIV